MSNAKSLEHQISSIFTHKLKRVNRYAGNSYYFRKKFSILLKREISSKEFIECMDKLGFLKKKIGDNLYIFNVSISDTKILSNIKKARI